MTAIRAVVQWFYRHPFVVAVLWALAAWAWWHNGRQMIGVVWSLIACGCWLERWSKAP